MSVNLQTEPVAIINSIVALIETILVLVVAFGISLDPGQEQAIMGAVVAAGAVVQTILARGRVFSPATVEEIVANIESVPEIEATD